MVSLKGRNGRNGGRGKDRQSDRRRGANLLWKNKRDERERRRERETGRKKRGRDSDDGGGSFREITGFTGTRLSGRECGCAEREREGKKGDAT